MLLKEDSSTFGNDKPLEIPLRYCIRALEWPIVVAFGCRQGTKAKMRNRKQSIDTCAGCSSPLDNNLERRIATRNHLGRTASHLEDGHILGPFVGYVVVCHLGTRSGQGSGQDTEGR